MSRKHCRRKVYERIDTLAHVIEGIAPPSKERLDQLRLLELAAIESFRIGKATKDDWKTVADMLNIAETMSRAGVGPEVLPVCETVQEALGNAHARLQKHGKLGMSGPEIQAMRELHAYHDLQRSSVTLGEYERAIQRTANRIHGANPGVKVFIDNPKEIRQELPYLSPSLTTREKV